VVRRKPIHASAQCSACGSGGRPRLWLEARFNRHSSHIRGGRRHRAKANFGYNFDDLGFK
jgi:hypothetical protein